MVGFLITDDESGLGTKLGSSGADEVWNGPVTRETSGTASNIN